jgi:hypothetical protein
MVESDVVARFLRDRFSSLLTYRAYGTHSTVSMAAFGVLSVFTALFSLWLVFIARTTIEKKP